MGSRFSPKKVAPDLSEPRVCSPEPTNDQVAGWKVYDDKKAAWVDAWAHYYDTKTTKNKTSWDQYEKGKDDVQRRWRSNTDASLRPPSPPKSQAAAGTKTFGLSVDTDLAAAARQWSIPEGRAPPRRRATVPLPES